MKFSRLAIVFRTTAILGLLSLYLMPIWPLAAQNQPASQGLTISPFLLERQLQKGQITREIIEVTNTSNQTLPVDLTVNDFVPVGDNGQQTFLEVGQRETQFSLASWIHIKNQPKLVLGPKEKTTVEFEISVPQDAEDGGHYGAILFTFQAGNLPGTNVAVVQKLGAIILAKLGKVNEEASITGFKTGQQLYSQPPVDFLVKFKNTGNVHVKPRGGITVTNLFGRKVGTVLINQNANNVLPNSERTFEGKWQEKFAFGRFKAEGEFVYGETGQLLTAQAVFWVLPWKTVLAFGLGGFLILALLVYGVKAYNRWLIAKVSGKRK